MCKINDIKDRKFKQSDAKKINHVVCLEIKFMALICKTKDK